MMDTAQGLTSARIFFDICNNFDPSLHGMVFNNSTLKQLYKQAVAHPEGTDPLHRERITHKSFQN